jgi:Flp pilus assembly protein TadG
MSAMHPDSPLSPAPAKEPARSQKGAALIEFALILPLFLTILFGVITFSAALYDKTVLTMATREGARAGAKYVAGSNTDPARINNARLAALDACDGLVSFAPGMICTVPAPTIQDDVLTVTANVSFTGLYIFSDLFGSGISAQTSMRLE